MKRRKLTAFLGASALVATLSTAALQSANVGAATAQQGPPDPLEAAVAAIPAEKGGNPTSPNTHTPDGPFSAEQRAMKTEGLEKKLRGKEGAQGKVAKLDRGKYIELAREKTERVFVIIAEFGDTVHPAFPPDPALEAKGGNRGPLHNEIPQPDRANDNTTLWKADYNKAHYEDMYFNRVAKYYQSQSSNRYSVFGDVNGWVKVPFNEARYGRDLCGGIVCNNTWFLIRDSMAYWVDGQLAAGKSMADINAYLSSFDIWDRYDYDNDGNFDEADGYIDHFQIVHAGQDQASGDPIYQSDAIWSHRWYAQLNPAGSTGPTVNGVLNPLGGTQIGQGGLSGGVVQIPNNRTGLWVGDYTIQPENGGLGVFVHEYGHDLGLPDLYDTSGNTGGGENSTGFWSLMSSGANIGNGGPDGIGDQPVDFGAWEKLQLGWLGCDTCAQGRFYDIADVGVKSEHKLGPNNGATKNAQALVVNLPDKERVTVIGPPFSGADFWYSGAGDDLSARMETPVSVPAAGGTFAAKIRYEAEKDFDYAYVSVSTTNGATWVNIPTNISDSATEPGISGSSGGAWVDLTANLGAYAGQNVLLAVRYITDGGVVELGVSIDDPTFNGAPLANWTLVKFKVTTGTEVAKLYNAYIAEYRNYRGYDKSLKTAYNFGFLNTRPDWVELYPYQPGLLVTYWDTSVPDNSVSVHPGSGQILPVDAHPQPMHWADGQLTRQRIQSYDSTFSKNATQAITLNKNSVPTSWPSLPAVTTFDDTKTWWFGSDEHTPASHGRYQVGWTSVDVPKTGTVIKIKEQEDDGNRMELVVNPQAKKSKDEKDREDAAKDARRRAERAKENKK